MTLFHDKACAEPGGLSNTLAALSWRRDDEHRAPLAARLAVHPRAKVDGVEIKILTKPIGQDLEVDAVAVVAVRAMPDFG
jgi:hypothetical protein